MGKRHPVLARLGDRSPDVNQISVHLLLICPCRSQYPLSASDGVARRRGSGGGDGGESRFIAASPRECHLPTYGTFRWDAAKEEEKEESSSFVPWSGSLAHANRAVASGERLARVLMELGQTHFTA